MYLSFINEMQEYLTQQIFLLLTGFGFEFMFNSSPIYVHLLNSLYGLTSPPRLDFNCQFVLYQPNSNTKPYTVLRKGHVQFLLLMYFNRTSIYSNTLISWTIYKFRHNVILLFISLVLNTDNSQMLMEYKNKIIKYVKFIDLQYNTSQYKL